MRLFLVLTCLLASFRNAQPCGVCLVPPRTVFTAKRKQTAIAIFDRLLVPKRGPLLFGVAALCLAKNCGISINRGYFLSDKGEEESDDMLSDETAAEEQEEEIVMSSAMIGTIGFYKNWISPLLPPACRFVPTCSQYGVQAIKEFGPDKGVLLIAWRLLRCSPFGGKGYDPPKWPPVAFTYSSY